MVSGSAPIAWRDLARARGRRAPDRFCRRRVCLTAFDAGGLTRPTRSSGRWVGALRPRSVLSSFDRVALSMTSRLSLAFSAATPLPRRIAIVQLIGFGLVLAVVWFNELVDLPHRVFGDPPTPARPSELVLESLGIVSLAVVVVVSTRAYLRRLAYLETFVVLCAWCRRVRLGPEWLSFESYLGKHRADTSHGMCPECEAKIAGDISKQWLC